MCESVSSCLYFSYVNNRVSYGLRCRERSENRRGGAGTKKKLGKG